MLGVNYSIKYLKTKLKNTSKRSFTTVNLISSQRCRESSIYIVQDTTYHILFIDSRFKDRSLESRGGAHD